MSALAPSGHYVATSPVNGGGKSGAEWSISFLPHLWGRCRAERSRGVIFRNFTNLLKSQGMAPKNSSCYVPILGLSSQNAPDSAHFRRPARRAARGGRARAQKASGAEGRGRGGDTRNLEKQLSRSWAGRPAHPYKFARNAPRIFGLQFAARHLIRAYSFGTRQLAGKCLGPPTPPRIFWDQFGGGAA